MSYLTHEYSAQDGDPLFKMQFVQGPDTFLYTTAPYIIGDSTGTWEPVPFKPAEITQSPELSKDGLKIVIPRDNALALTFIGGVPEVVTSVTIFRQHAGDVTEEYITAWKGRVAGVDISGDLVTLNCENIFTSMRRPGLRAVFQRSCRHALYNTGCNLTDYDFATAATVTAATGDTLTLADIVNSNFEEGYFQGGTLETSDGYKRFIIRQQANILILTRPILSLNDVVNSSVGEAAVTLYPGCDHTSATCLTKFNNLANYGGFPHIPTVNPFSNSITGSIV